MNTSEFRKLYGVEAADGHQSMTAEEWREMMRKKKNKPDDKNRREIATMLRLAKIQFVEEYRFHPTRKWRFDFAIVDKKIAIEYEGIFAGKSRHTTITGFMGDNEKYNAATLMGWRVLRYTASKDAKTANYKQVIEDLKTMI